MSKNGQYNYLHVLVHYIHLILMYIMYYNILVLRTKEIVFIYRVYMTTVSHTN